jgi:hypothetical protein
MAFPTIVSYGCNMQPPQVDEFNCAPTVTDGEVTEIYLTAAPLLEADLADAASFALKLDQQPDSQDDVVRIKVTGKIAVAEPPVVRVEGGQEIRAGKYKFSLEAEQFNDTDINYAAVRMLQYGNKPMIMYFRVGNNLYGGAENVHDGISVNVSAYQTAEGPGNLVKNIYKASWEDALQPNRQAHPLA